MFDRFGTPFKLGTVCRRPNGLVKHSHCPDCWFVRNTDSATGSAGLVSLGRLSGSPATVVNIEFGLVVKTGSGADWNGNWPSSGSGLPGTNGRLDRKSTR